MLSATQLARRGAQIIRQGGWHRLYSSARRRVLPAWGALYSAEALAFAQDLDFTARDLEQSRACVAAHPGAIDVRTICWFLPHFDHAYYGGMHTILRFAARLARQHGVRSSFVLLGGAGLLDEATYQARIAEPFPALAGAPVVVARGPADLARVPACDAAIATFWSSAYTLLKFNRTRRKCYFIQDFEPMFYPAGSISAQAEATYRFGFYGLANTVALKECYEQEYGGRAAHFDPCVDTSLFYPEPDRRGERTGQPYTVFFYARPGYARNGFELGVQALRQLKHQLGPRVRIVTAGQRWSASSYGLGGAVENLGLLSYAETARLYRGCDVGLTMMFTRHPSYLPFELMASGCLVVSNVNRSTAWLLRDGENCLLAPPSASSLAETLARALEEQQLRRAITANALALIRERFADWEGQADKVYRYVCDPEAH